MLLLFPMLFLSAYSMFLKIRTLSDIHIALLIRGCPKESLDAASIFKSLFFPPTKPTYIKFSAYFQNLTDANIEESVFKLISCIEKLPDSFNTSLKSILSDNQCNLTDEMPKYITLIREVINNSDILKIDSFFQVGIVRIRERKLSIFTKRFFAYSWAQKYINSDNLTPFIQSFEDLTQRKVLLEFLTPIYENEVNYSMQIKKIFPWTTSGTTRIFASMTAIFHLVFQIWKIMNHIALIIVKYIICFVIFENDEGLKKFIEFLNLTKKLEIDMLPDKLDFKPFPESKQCLIECIKSNPLQCRDFIIKFAMKDEICNQLLDEMTEENKLFFLIFCGKLSPKLVEYHTKIDSQLQYSEEPFIIQPIDFIHVCEKIKETEMPNLKVRLQY